MPEGWGSNIMKQGLKKLAGLIYGIIGGRGSSSPILMYHSIHPSHPLAVRPTAFTEQIAYLVENYRVVSLPAYIEAVGNGSLLPGMAAVTFDDGYRDNYEYAFPVLQKYNCPATIFITSGFIEAKNPLKFGQQAYLYPDLLPLSWKELRAMEPLVMIGAHTHSHIQITGVTEAVLERELLANVASLKENLGVIPRIFAYPWGQPGDYLGSGCDLIKKFFQGAVTTVFGAGNHRVGGDRYQLRRVAIGPADDLDIFAGKVAGAYDFLGPVNRWRSRFSREQGRNITSILGSN